MYNDWLDLLVSKRTELRRISGISLLFWAISLNNAHMVTLLLDKNVGKQGTRHAFGENTCGDSDGNAPLHYAVSNNALSVVEILLHRKDIKVNIKNTKTGMTPFHLAALSGNMDIINLLIGANSNKNVRDKNGNTALNLVLDEKKLNIAVKLFVEMNAKANPDNIGNDLFYGFGFYGGKDGFPLHQNEIALQEENRKKMEEERKEIEEGRKRYFVECKVMDFSSIDLDMCNND